MNIGPQRKRKSSIKDVIHMAHGPDVHIHGSDTLSLSIRGTSPENEHWGFPFIGKTFITM